MTEDDLTSLFNTGTSPQRDPDFARRIAAEMRRMRRRETLNAVVRTTGLAAFAGGLLFLIRILGPWWLQLAVEMPEILGVPLPLVIGGLLLAATIHLWRWRRGMA